MSSEVDKEDTREGTTCICQRWPMLVMSLAFFLFGALGLIVSYALTQEKSLEHKYHYGVIIDAGSSHTGVTVYRWPSDAKYKGTAKVKQITFATCSKDGIANFKDNPEEAGHIITRCINVATSSVPKKDRTQTPIYVGATAGMRLLCAKEKSSCDPIMQSVKDAVAKSDFKQQNESTKILTGEEEGVFGWMSVNVIKKTIDSREDDNKNSSIFGALDMGGASAEISFIPRDGKIIPAQYNKTLRAYGNTYSLYTHSFLCYGMKEAERRLLAALIERSGYSLNVTNPCYPTDFMKTVFGGEIWQLPCSLKPKSSIFPLNPQSEFLITGSGDYDGCRKAVKMLFNETECEYGSCSFDGVYQPEVLGKFIAYSGYGYVATFLNVTGKESLKSLKESGQLICKENWNALRKNHKSTPEKYLYKYCFNAEYIHQILTYGFHFKEDSKQITFVNKINGIEVGWSLGFMVNATNLIPSETAKSVLGRRNFIFFTGLSVIVIIFSLILCFCYSIKKYRTKNSDYQYKPLDYNG